MPRKKKGSSIELEHDESISHEPDEEQGIRPVVHGEEEALDMETGNKDEDIYDETGRELLQEEDELKPEEEGFVKGYQKKRKR